MTLALVYVLGLATPAIAYGLLFFAVWLMGALERHGWVIRTKIHDDTDPRIEALSMKWRRWNIGPFWIGDRAWERGDDQVHVSAWMGVGKLGGRGLYVAHGKQLR